MKPVLSLIKVLELVEALLAHTHMLEVIYKHKRTIFPPVFIETLCCLLRVGDG